MRVEWTHAAWVDLEAVAELIAEDRPGAAAEPVLAAIHAALDLLPVHPGIARPGRVPATRELVVAYRVTAGAIQVLRVLPGARQWPERM